MAEVATPKDLFGPPFLPVKNVLYVEVVWMIRGKG